MGEALQSIAIGLLAPFGIWLGWLFQRKDKKAERLEARRELLRQKAEEIFADAERVEERAQAAVMQSLEDVHDSARSVAGTISLVQSPKLNVLLRMYFPESEPLLSTYAQRIGEALTPSIKIGEAPNDPDPAKHLKNLKNARLESAKLCATVHLEMVAAIRHFMVQQTRAIV